MSRTAAQASPPSPTFDSHSFKLSFMLPSYCFWRIPCSPVRFSGVSPRFLFQGRSGVIAQSSSLVRSAHSLIGQVCLELGDQQSNRLLCQRSYRKVTLSQGPKPLHTLRGHGTGLIKVRVNAASRGGYRIGALRRHQKHGVGWRLKRRQ